MVKHEKMRETIDDWNATSDEFLKNIKEVDDIVAPSYNTLPHYLRDCFTYLGVFPENYEIPVWTLINLWIAEGFIQPQQERSLEETAEENVMDLIDRNLMIVCKTNPIGKVKTCRVHALIHSFSKSKAANWRFFVEIKMSMSGIFEPPISDVQNYRRVCVHSDLLEFLSRKPRSQNLRSLLCFYEKPIILDSEYASAITDAFCLLKVFATNSVKFTQFPKEVTKLIHLRYITLCSDSLQVLPEDISQLWNLQTVVVDTKSLSLTVKANIWKMIKLRHVKTKAAIILDIQGEEGEASENLQTLSKLSPGSFTSHVISRARKLKTLGIRGQLTELPDATDLRELDCLENLKLVNDLNSPEAAASHHIRGGLVLNRFPLNLKTLTLSATYLSWDNMYKLEMIETLKVLKLKNYAFTGESWCSSRYYGFPGLEFLLIASTDLILWEASTEDFPRLSYLVLKNCEKISKIPKSLAKSLKKLDIENIAISAVESAKEIEKEKGSGFKLSIGVGCE